MVAVNDGVIKKIGESERLGRYVWLQDVYGNRYTYAHLGSVAEHYPVPKQDATDPTRAARVKAKGDDRSDPTPSGAASPVASRGRGRRRAGRSLEAGPRSAAGERAGQAAPVRAPGHGGRAQAGGLEQLLEAKARKRRLRDLQELLLAPLRARPQEGHAAAAAQGLARVIGGTILGRVGARSPPRAAAPRLRDPPGGRGAPRIDPKPILDGWKLLEATAIYRASGKNVLLRRRADGMSIGQILLLPKPQLEKRVLADERIEIYACGRDDIRPARSTGACWRRSVPRRVRPAADGHLPQVRPRLLHDLGQRLRPLLGQRGRHRQDQRHPDPGPPGAGGITEQAVRRLMQLQGTMAPHQVISLLEVGGPTIAMADHADHIHVGFRRCSAANQKLGKQALAVLKPGQWIDLIDAPARDREPGRAHQALEVRAAAGNRGQRASDAHQGE